MKNIKKIIIVLLELFIIIFLVSLISSKYLSYFEKKPFIVFKKNEYEYFDGKVIEYISIFHKTIKYDRESMKKFDVVLFFKKHNTGQENFKIIYDDTKCNNVGEEIYRDDIYIYTLPCYNSEDIKIKFENNIEMNLKEALDNKKVTIDALKKKRLLIDKTPIN